MVLIFYCIANITNLYFIDVNDLDLKKGSSN